jgi:hypothetical protein
MTAAALLNEARRLGIILAPHGDRLGYESPPGALTPDLRTALTAHKAELLALLTAEGLPPRSPPNLSVRWGPGRADSTPGIDQPTSDWRWRVAHWLAPLWAAWLRRAGELEPPAPTAEQIRAAEWQSYQEMTRAPESGPID